MTNEEQAFITAVEVFVDNNGMGCFMDMISIICREKADHIRASYDQGDAMAELWDSRADLVNNFASNF